MASKASKIEETAGRLDKIAEVYGLTRENTDEAEAWWWTNDGLSGVILDYVTTYDEDGPHEALQLTVVDEDGQPTGADALDPRNEDEAGRAFRGARDVARRLRAFRAE